MDDLTSQRMVSEDPHILQAMLYGITASSSDHKDIEIAELVADRSSRSPAMNGFLVHAYGALPAELSNDIKIRIEAGKLEQKGKGYLVQFLGDKTRTLLEMVRSVPEHHADASMTAAHDYMLLANSFSYVRFSNSQRADMHMGLCAKLCADAPTVFGTFIDPIARAYVVRKYINPENFNDWDALTFHRLHNLWRLRA